MYLNENEENKKSCNSSNCNKNLKIHKRDFKNLLELKRKRNFNDTIEYNKIMLSETNDYLINMRFSEEIDFFNLSTSEKSLSIDNYENDYKYNNFNYNCEEKILKLKLALQDKPYFQYQNIN